MAGDAHDAAAPFPVKVILETALLTETEKLKSENEEFRKALKEFRTKLVETVVFNSNLTTFISS
ncbi:MAG: hypothetical protein EBU90_29210 [Proteobacteria bacterium]|nr:hypothetical protein [Pseudomonadota bacterium]